MDRKGFSKIKKGKIKCQRQKGKETSENGNTPWREGRRWLNGDDAKDYPGSWDGTSVYVLKLVKKRMSVIC